MKPAEKPNWKTRYQLGVRLNREMEHVCTLDEIAAELGITRQNAYTETVVALGTLAWHLQVKLVPPSERPRCA